MYLIFVTYCECTFVMSIKILAQIIVILDENYWYLQFSKMDYGYIIILNYSTLVIEQHVCASIFPWRGTCKKKKHLLRTSLVWLRLCRQL